MGVYANDTVGSPTLGAASLLPHTHTHQGYPLAPGAGWLLGGGVEEPWWGEVVGGQ